MDEYPEDRASTGDHPERPCPGQFIKRMRKRYSRRGAGGAEGRPTRMAGVDCKILGRYSPVLDLARRSSVRAIDKLTGGRSTEGDP